MLISLTFAALGLLVAASAAPLEPRQAGTYWTDSGVSGILSTCSTPGTIAITFGAFKLGREIAIGGKKSDDVALFRRRSWGVHPHPP